jgi:hypothetical protein
LVGHRGSTVVGRKSRRAKDVANSIRSIAPDLSRDSTFEHRRGCMRTQRRSIHNAVRNRIHSAAQIRREQSQRPKDTLGAPRFSPYLFLNFGSRFSKNAAIPSF